MKAKVLAVLLSAIITISVAGCLTYYTITIHSNQNATIIDVKITDLSVANPDVLVWDFVSWSFNVSIQNFGNRNASDIALYVSMVHNTTKTELWNYTTALETMPAGDQVTLSGKAFTGMTAWDAWAEKFPIDRGTVFYNATLVYDNRILDEKIVI